MPRSWAAARGESSLSFLRVPLCVLLLMQASWRRSQKYRFAPQAVNEFSRGDEPGKERERAPVISGALGPHHVVMSSLWQGVPQVHIGHSQVRESRKAGGNKPRLPPHIRSLNHEVDGAELRIPPECIVQTKRMFLQVTVIGFRSDLR